MSRLNPFFNWGSELKDDNPTLHNQLTEVYASIARAMNTKASKMVATTNPPATGQVNSSFDIGDLWVNTATDAAWIMTSRASDITVTWTSI